jgi:hypothetical protein
LSKHQTMKYGGVDLLLQVFLLSTLDVSSQLHASAYLLTAKESWVPNG